MKNKILFLFIFTTAGFIFLQIPFHKLMGSDVSFTLFDFFGPIAGAFLGPAFGIASVLFVEIIDIFLKHTALTSGTLIRIFPTLFAVWYFSIAGKQSNRVILFVPIFAIFLFVLNPTGRTVWYYSLFWLIPLAVYFKRNNVFLRSLGATFTAHAAGGATWVWTFHLPVSVWNSLIPVVIQERLLFAAGIAISYILAKYILSYLASKHILPRLESIAVSIQ